MTERHTPRIVPLVDLRSASLPPPAAALSATGRIAANGLLSDALGRPLRDLRISVTDRCNFRCNYCMPKEVFDKDYAYLPHSHLLSFEEISRIASVFVGRGVRKIRLTGGEPLLRKNIEILVAQLAALRTPDGRPRCAIVTTAHLGDEERPLVSADYARDTRSSIVDALSTMVTDGTLLKVYAWYDNEMGYACRMVDLACHMNEQGL